MSSVADRYGVFGHPVGHSLSPFIHAMFARETAQDISYRAFEVTAEEFTARVHTFFGEGGRGLNITLPHKLAAVEVAVELTDRAAHAAAVNTLSMHDGGILGDNTDGIGLVNDLCDNQGLVVTSRRLLILGAGGATRGVLAPLLRLEPELIVIANRTAERAAALAAAFADLGATQARFEEVGAEPSISSSTPPRPVSRARSRRSRRRRVPRPCATTWPMAGPRPRSWTGRARPAARARCRAWGCWWSRRRNPSAVARHTPRHLAGAGGAEGRTGST